MTRPRRLRLSRAAMALTALIATAMVATPSLGAAEDGTRGKVAGLGISRPGLPQQVIANDLGRMRKTGVNTGMIDVWWDVDGEDANTMHPGSITSSDADVGLAIQRAKAEGLRVMFQPKLWCPKCQPLHWRGILKPKSREKFFRNYRIFINHYAQLAQREGVEALFIGSEMNTLQGETAEWREVARQARESYPGKLAYEVNWDTWSKPKFWDAVDIVSVSAYFPLSDAARPTVAELKAGWRGSRTKEFKGRNWFGEMEQLAKTSGKPVLFGECGYLSSTYAARRPYDEAQHYDPDQQVQADAYQAVLETFEGEPWWAGVVWWEWFPSTGGDPSQSTSYSPRDKLAETFLTTWYATGWRPGAPGGPGRSAVPAPAPIGALLPPDLAAAGASAARNVPRDAVAAGGSATPVVRDPAPAIPAVVNPWTPGDPNAGRTKRRAIKALALLLVLESFIGHRALVRRRRRLRRVNAAFTRRVPRLAPPSAVRAEI